MLWIDANSSVGRKGITLTDDRTSTQAHGLFGRIMRIAQTEMRNAKLDAVTMAIAQAKLDNAVDQVTAESYNAYVAKYRGRNDAVGSEGGGLFAGQLRQVLGQVLEEKHPIPNGLKAFRMDGSLPVGTASFEIQREYSSGSARVWGKGGGKANIPNVSIGQGSMTVKVHNYVTSVVYDVFEEMGASLANVQLAARLMRVARNVLEQFANEMIFFGDPSYKIWGVLNYPWLRKQLSASNWYGTPADSRTVLTELNAYANQQFFDSHGVFGSSKVATSPRVGSWLMQQPMGTTSTINDRTIGEVFLAGQGDRIQGPIAQWHELENVLGDGVDAILFYRDDEMGIENIVPGGGIQTLPFWSDDIDRRQILFMPHGGVVMREVGNMLLVFVNAAA